MDINEQRVAAAFTKQSGIFDEYFSGNSIIRYKRKRVRDVIQEFIPRPGAVLELNSGTGEDAVWLAEQGHRVHATDLSSGMLEVLRDKVALRGLQESVSSECCSYTALHALKRKGPYDLIFSNFAGLNCTNELANVLDSFDRLLKPGGTVILVVMPKFCLWETALLFTGKFKTAFRRFFGKKGASARVEGNEFSCWYYNPSFIARTLTNSFQLARTEGLCFLVPPSYIEQFPEKHPVIYRFLKKAEERLKTKWPWNRIGDYYIIALKKKTSG
ncbi:MAG TPA: class I SAM-dependent methyltransferase [Puia sp.]|jgi:ubiquinone/menaquinone biosynthesis C-methylase UbiE